MSVLVTHRTVILTFAVLATFACLPISFFLAPKWYYFDDSDARSAVLSQCAPVQTRRASNDSEHLHKPLAAFLVIMMPVRPTSFEERQLVRTTWYSGLADSKEVLLRFCMGVLGQPADLIDKLNDENRTYGDLVYFTDIRESASALTNKTIGLLNWAHENVNFSYLLKCDDDTFVYVKRAIEELKRRKSTTQLYYGYLRTGSVPKETGKWPDTSWNLGRTYLPFMYGGGYFLSHDLVSLLAVNRYRLRWFINEDTAIGAWLAGYQVEKRTDSLICRSVANRVTGRCSKNAIVHLYYKQSNLTELFIERSRHL